MTYMSGTATRGSSARRLYVVGPVLPEALLLVLEEVMLFLFG